MSAYTPIEVVFLYHSLAPSGTVWLYFARLDENGNALEKSADLLSFTPKKKLKPMPTPGAIYEIGEYGDGTWNLSLGAAGRMRWKRQYHDLAKRAEWRIADDEFDVRQRVVKAEKTARRDDPIAECLRPIIAQYNKTDEIGRRAIEVRILATLRTSRTIKW